MNQVVDDQIDYRRIIGSHLIYGIFEIMIVGIIIYILINFTDFYNFKDQLNDNFKTWFYGYSSLYFIYILRRMYLLCLWFTMDDPRIIQGVINFYTFVFLSSFEMVWFIWGNTFFFEEKQVLLSSEPDLKNLKIILILILIYGYIQLLSYAVSTFFFLFVFCSAYTSGSLDRKAEKDYKKKILEKHKNKLRLNDDNYTIKVKDFIEQVNEVS